MLEAAGNDSLDTELADTEVVNIESVDTEFLDTESVDTEPVYTEARLYLKHYGPDSTPCRAVSPDCQIHEAQSANFIYIDVAKLQRN
jgi:hypothetical protein